jgi:cell division protein FtsQ
MATKRKISIRKILQLFVTVVVTTCCIIAMVSASRIEDSKKLKSIAVHIKNDKKYHFIEQKEILDLAITKPQIDVEHTPVSRLDLHAMERTIMADPWVANAQVFVDNDNVLQMYVTQRIPVARVFDKSNRSYYLDTTLSIMPVSPNYIYYTTLITNAPDINNDSAGWALRKDVITLVRALQADSFWNAQVSQVVVDSLGMYELVPVLGDQRIILGSVARLHDKLSNLFLFYKNVLNRIGWDKYETLDLRFKGQVVAAPSLPYKGPVDRAVVNMNWINSIVETEARNDARNDAKDSVRAAAKQSPAAPAAKPEPAAKDKKKPVAPVKLVVHGAPPKKGAAPLRKKGANKPVKKPVAKPSKAAPPKPAAHPADKSKTPVAVPKKEPVKKEH